MTVGLGCMRLSTAADRDDARAAAVLDAALAAGVELLDTADAYCHSDEDLGHNERLIAAAIARAGTRIFTVTKGGLTRPDGAWVASGRARHLAAAARGSRDRLGVDALDLYLLHAIDPKTPLATSVRALAKLRDDGVARAIGLSNINPTQLDEALAVTAIDAVEVELSPWKLDAIRSGLVARCEQRSIRVLAHRPLGGPPGIKRAARDPVIAAIAERHGVRPAEVILAWLRSLSPAIVTLPGPTRVDTARRAIAGQRLVLDADARDALAARFLAIGSAAPAATGAEVVMIAGMPAAGKTTLAADYVARGYARLNRDERGGSLLDLAVALDDELANGATRVVLDNTYGTRASRAPVLEVARRHGASVRCVVVATSIEHAQAHAVTRMLERHGRLLEPAELRGKESQIGPGAQFRYRRDHEPPTVDEGFSAIDVVVPARASSGGRAGLIVELDGIVWKGRPARPEQITLLEGARDALAAWSQLVVGATLWRPGATPDAIAALAARLVELVGLAIDVRHCAHLPGPPVCWCRKPLPGLGLALARDHALDLSRTLHLGRGPADRGFATRVGVRFHAIEDGWPTPDAVAATAR